MPPEDAAAIQLLIEKINSGRILPLDEGTFLGYMEVHTALGLPRKGPQWGNSLRRQGMEALAQWAQNQGLPAVTGLIVREAEPRRPGKGYYEINGREDDDVEWWRQQVRLSIRQDWSPWVHDIGPVSLRELSDDSRSYIDGARIGVQFETRRRCVALRTRAKALFRNEHGVLRCEICGFTKPDARLSGDIVELHHLDPIAHAPDEGRIVTVADLPGVFVPVCPTGHRMLHARLGGGQFNVQELRALLQLDTKN